MPRQLIATVTTMFVAVGMAFLTWAVAIQEENPITMGLYSQEISVDLVSPAENVVLTAGNTLPDTVQVRLRAPRSSWERLTPNHFKATLDLSGYGVGVHDVLLQVRATDPQIVIEEVFPASAQVQLEPLATKDLPVTFRLQGDPPNGFAYRLPRNPITVTVKGPAVSVTDVERVEAQIFLNNAKESVEREIKPVPKNIADETVSSVSLELLTQTVTISVEQKFGYNTVSVKAPVIGQPAAGYFINSITTEPDEIVLRGLDEAPSAIETGEIDISNTTEDVVKRVPLTLPPGFSIEVDENDKPEDGRSILVTVEISAFSGGLNVEREVTVQGALPEFTWQIDPESVEILLRGPVPMLQNLTNEDVTVIVDLFGLEPGIHKLKPAIIKPQELEVGSIIPDIVQVTIAPAQAATTPTATTSATDTLTNTQSLSETLLITTTLTLTQ